MNRNSLFLIGLLLLILVGASIGAFSVKQIAATNAKTTAMATAQANATQTAIAANYPFSDKLVLNDPLHDNSKGYSWQNNAGCNFTDKGYLVSESQQNTYQPCLTTGTANFSNFTYEVEMTITKGDCGGLTFRSDDALTRFYYFRVCQGGYYDLSSIGKDAASSQTLINYSPSGFPVNLQQTTQIAVEANGNAITLYINKMPLGTVTNADSLQGKIGVIAEDITNPTTVVYTDAHVWSL